MNASAYPHDTDTFGWRTRHAVALLASSASLLSRVFAVVLALALGGLGWLALATIEDAERVSVALFLSGLAVAALWGIWFARLLLLHIEAHRSRIPGVAMAIGGTVALVFLATVLVPALLLSLGGVDLAVAICAMALGACAGVLAATLPRIVYLALCLAPLVLGLMAMILERVLPTGTLQWPALTMHHLTWLAPPALALAAWRWWAIAGREPGQDGSVWWQPAVVGNPRTGGGFSWMSGDAATAQLPDWLWPAGQTRDAGPARPVLAVRALLGTPFAPLSGSQIVVQLAVGVAAMAYLWLSALGEDGDPGVLVGGAIGGAAVMVVMYGQRLDAMSRKQGGEVEELALLPGLGDDPDSRRAVVLGGVLRAPALAMGAVLLILAVMGTLLAMPTQLLALVLMAGVGVVLTTVLACLRPLAGQRMDGWRMAVVAGPMLVFAMGTILYAVHGDGQGQAPLVLALAWLFAYAVLAVHAMGCWQRMKRRPHLFLQR